MKSDLVRVQDLKSIGGNPKLIRVNAIKNVFGIWMEITTNLGLRQIDFSGFDFDSSLGDFKDTLVYINVRSLSRTLFVARHDLDRILAEDVMQTYNLEAVCVAPNVQATTTILPMTNLETEALQDHNRLR